MKTITVLSLQKVSAEEIDTCAKPGGQALGISIGFMHGCTTVLPELKPASLFPPVCHYWTN